MELGLEGKVAVVGGSSRGIGLAIAEGLLAEGAAVVLTGRDETRLAGVERDLSARFGADRLLAVAGDLSDDGSAAAVVARTLARWGRLDVLVASAGGGAGDGSDTPDAAEWDRMLTLNLRTAVSLVQAALPAMMEAGRGAITLVGSIAGMESLGAPLPYGAAKAALAAYARDLARRAGPRGVRVNCVAPGNVLFPGGSWQRRLDERPDEVMRTIRTEVPLGRFGSPAEIADLVAFLSSDRAAFITGALLVADGGQTRGS